MFSQFVIDIAKKYGPITAGVYALFELIERLASDELRQRIIQWIEKRNSQKVVFREVFSSLFGKKQISIKCITFTILYSLIFSVSLALAFGLFRLEQLKSFYDVVLELAFVLAIVPCYFSVWKARFFLSKVRSKSRIPLWLMLDLAASPPLYTLAVFLGAVVANLFEHTSLVDAILYSGTFVHETWLDALGIGDGFEILDADKGLLIGLSNFLSVSALGWLLLLSRSAVRLVSLLSPPRVAFKAVKLLKYNEQPFRVLGLAAAAAAALFFGFVDAAIVVGHAYLGF